MGGQRPSFEEGPTLNQNSKILQKKILFVERSGGGVAEGIKH